MPKSKTRQNKRKKGEEEGSSLKEEDLDLLISTEELAPEKKKHKNKIKSSQLHKTVTFEKGSGGEEVPLVSLEEQERIDREREFQAYYEIKAKHQKENIIDAKLLEQRIKDVKPVHKGEPVEWVETLACLSEKLPISNPNDDLSRELSFYTQALNTLKLAKPLLQAAKVPFTRPDDYFAEMLKSDEHMAKARKRLLSEQERIKSAESRRRQRELKTIGKKIQVQKEQEKEMRKKANIESIKKWRKERQHEKSLNEVLDDSEFNRDKPRKKGKGKGPGNKNEKANPVSSLPVFKPQKFKNPVHGKKKIGGRGGSKSKGRRRR